MKKINHYKLLAGICALALLTACNFEEINTNPYEMTDEMGIRDGIAIGGSVTAMEKSVFPVGTQLMIQMLSISIRHHIICRLTRGADSSDRIIIGLVEVIIQPTICKIIGFRIPIRIHIRNWLPPGKK